MCKLFFHQQAREAAFIGLNIHHYAQQGLNIKTIIPGIRISIFR